MKDLIQAKTAIHDIDEWAEYEAQLDKASSCTGEIKLPRNVVRDGRDVRTPYREDLGPCALFARQLSRTEEAGAGLLDS
jgi:hypothetical protein